MFDPSQLFDQLTLAFNRRDWEGALRVAAQLIPLAPGTPASITLPDSAILKHSK